MNDLDFGDAVVTPVPDDPDAFVYAPKAPGLAHDASGRKQLNLLTAGPAAFVQLTAQWGLDSARVEALRAELATRLKRDVAALKLAPAADTVRAVVLLLGDGTGRFTPLQTGRSSGVPPHHAVFNVPLSGEQLARVRRALAGERGFLALRYDLTRRRPYAAGASLYGAAAESSERDEPGRSCASSAEYAAEISVEERGAAPERFSAQSDAADWARGP